MAYKRKTKDVVCKKCKQPSTVPIKARLSGVCCGRWYKGYRCLGDFKLVKK